VNWKQNFINHIADYLIRVETPPKELQVTAVDPNNQSDGTPTVISAVPSEKFGRNDKVIITKDGKNRRN
jgi:hypothetical protein